MHIDVASLTSFIVELLGASGAKPHVASGVAHCVVDADLTGYASHGVNTISSYLDEIHQRQLDPRAEPSVTKERDGWLVVDGNRGFGHYAALWTTNRVIEKAREYGVGIGCLGSAGHIGRLGYYAERIVAARCIGVVITGYGNVPMEALVAPPGGKENLLGTNPIAIGVPSGDHAPLLHDMATSAATYFQVEYAAKSGSSLPAGCIADAEGKPSTDPSHFYSGGSILSFGGHKGFGLGLAACLLGGLATSGDIKDDALGGTLILALDINWGGNAEGYLGRVRRFLHRVRQSATFEAERPVRVPGDRMRVSRDRGMRDGIEIAPPIWDALSRWAVRLDVPLPPAADLSPEAACGTV